MSPGGSKLSTHRSHTHWTKYVHIGGQGGANDGHMGGKDETATLKLMWLIMRLKNALRKRRPVEESSSYSKLLSRYPIRDTAAMLRGNWRWRSMRRCRSSSKCSGMGPGGALGAGIDVGAGVAAGIGACVPGTGNVGGGAVVVGAGVGAGARRSSRSQLPSSRNARTTSKNSIGG